MYVCIWDTNPCTQGTAVVFRLVVTQGKNCIGDPFKIIELDESLKLNGSLAHALDIKTTYTHTVMHIRAALIIIATCQVINYVCPDIMCSTTDFPLEVRWLVLVQHKLNF